jgi:ATP-binding cassette subfamily B protein
MWKLKKYLRHYKKESIIGPLFKLLEACFELLVPLVMARIVDVGIRQGDLPYIRKMCIVMVAFGVLGLVCSVTAQFFAAKAATGFGTELREDLFAHINRFSYRELDRVGTSTLVTRITSDINQTQAGVNLLLRLFLRAPFIVVGAVIMAFTVNVHLAWYFVVLVPLLCVVIFGIMLVTIPIYKKVQNQLDVVLRLTRESLAGARVVRAFSRQEDEIREFQQESQVLMNTQLLVGKISALLNPATYIIINAATILILWLGGKRVYIGNLTQGELIALINYMSQILLALIALANLIVSATKAMASAARINDVFAVAPSMEEGTEKDTGKEPERKVVFDHVAFAYEGGGKALTDICLEVKAGQTIGIIGGTGSGKSTLVNLIPRFYDATAGRVLVEGEDVKDYTFAGLRGKVGVVPQNAVLFAGTIRENMQWGKRDASDEEIWKALTIAQAREFVEKMPQGLDTQILQSGKNLSGGQRQRLTIARALVGSPQILILDDSASALDFATDAALRRAIAEQTKGMTVFIVSQRANSIKQADQILVLDEGCQVGLGTHRDLVNTCDVYREICLSQFTEEEVQSWTN